MATTLWGNVYFGDVFAGTLEQRTGGRCAFTYDASFLGASARPIAHTLPLREMPHLSEGGLHPFFDNLVAEGWLRQAQARALGVRRDDRFALLLAFGRDCAGAVSIVDPKPSDKLKLDWDDPEALAALTSRASLSGIQPKVPAVRDGRRFRPATAEETSTHIAKLPSGQLPGIVEIEYLTSLAVRALLPGDPVAEVRVGALGNVAAEALIVRRFDRAPDRRKLHFEEFAQLLGRPSEDKYEGSYEEMGRFILETPHCVPAETDRLFRRVLACLLTGNTDAHLKNFAMLHTADGLRLAPSYDLVAAALYKDYQTIALAFGGAANLRLDRVRAKHIASLGRGFGLADGAIALAIEELGKRREAAAAAVRDSGFGHAGWRDGLIRMMEARWNGTFASTGSFLSRRPATAARRKASLSAASPRSRR